MGLVTATPAELRKIQQATEALRMELMRHATAGCMTAGWQSKDALGMAVMMVLVGAAQRFALMDRGLYHIFKTLCSDMANSEADSVVTRSLIELGPEATGH